MIKKGLPYLFGVWVFLIVIPPFLPLFTLNYPPYYDQFSSLSLYPHFIPLTFILFLTPWGKVNLSPLPITTPLILLAAGVAVSASYAAVDSRLALIMLARILLALITYFALKHLPLPPQHIVWAVVAFVLCQGTVAVLQFIIQDDLGLRFLGEYDLVAEPGCWSIVFGADQVWLRGYGLTPHPNILGGLLASGLAVVFCGSETKSSKWLLGLSIFSFAMGVAGILVTFSRSAWLGAFAGLAFGLLAFLLLNGRSMFALIQDRQIIFYVMAFVIGTGVMLPSALPVLHARSTPQENQVMTQSVGERQILNRYALDVIQGNWVLGQGGGNFGPAMLETPNRNAFVNIHPVHNVPLLVTAELGFAGGLIWLWLMAFPPLFTLREAWCGRANRFLIGMAAALVALAVVDLFDYYSYGWPHGITWRWMFFGLFAYAVVVRDACICN